MTQQDTTTKYHEMVAHAAKLEKEIETLRAARTIDTQEMKRLRDINERMSLEIETLKLSAEDNTGRTSQESVVVHRHPDEVRSVKIEQNSRGFNVTVKAQSVDEALDMYRDARGRLNGVER